MFSSPPPLPDAANDGAPADDLAQRQLDALERMAGRCERVAEALERRLLRLAERADGTLEEEAATAGAINAASLAFDRANRAVRLALMLQAKVRDGARAAAAQRRADAAEAAGRRQEQVASRRQTLLRALGAAITGERRDPAETERLVDRGIDWLHDQGEEGLLARPVGALVEQVLAHLGIAFDADRFEPESWAIQECIDRPPGSPYAAPQASWRPRYRAARAGADPAARPP